MLSAHAHLGPIRYIIQTLQTSPISQTSFLDGTFFAAFYSNIALIFKTELINSKFVKSMRKIFSNLEDFSENLNYSEP